MNQTERTLAQSLAECRTIPVKWDDSFIRSIAWLALHEPNATLSGLQRYNLYLMAYRYRRQLAGRVDHDLIPVDPPNKADYVRPQQPQLQRDLLDGSARPVEFDEPLEVAPTNPQRRLI